MTSGRGRPEAAKSADPRVPMKPPPPGSQATGGALPHHIFVQRGETRGQAAREIDRFGIAAHMLQGFQQRHGRSKRAQRIAMVEDYRRIGERLQQRRQPLHVVGRLHDPALSRHFRLHHLHHPPLIGKNRPPIALGQPPPVTRHLHTAGEVGAGELLHMNVEALDRQIPAILVHGQVFGRNRVEQLVECIGKRNTRVGFVSGRLRRG